MVRKEFSKSRAMLGIRGEECNKLGGNEMQREPAMKRPLLGFVSVLALAACSEPQQAEQATETETETTAQDEAGPATSEPTHRFSAETGREDPATSIRLPDGFTATVFADELGRTRHIAVRDDQTVYAGLRRAVDGKGTVALRDSDGDGQADETAYFGEIVGTGIAIHNGYLYRSSDTEIVRFRLEPGEMVPTAAPESIVTGFPEQRQHATKPMTFDGDGNMYVTVGAPSNACQERMRTPGSPGLEPCPQLERQAGIWRFDADTPGQVHGEDGKRYATGIRNGLSIDWHPAAGALYFASHGRDSLSDLFPEYFTEEQNAELPAEEFHRAQEGSDHGWPYTYWDPIENARVIAPEYGGDGEKTAEPGQYEAPEVAFPGHWAPNDLIFYTGNAFPEDFRNGAFIAWHGSWNRAPLPQDGYKVAFIPMNEAGEVTEDWFVFADKFKGQEPLASPGDAEYRPAGLAVGPDGALYIAEDQTGRIWKVTYQGS